MSNTDSDWRKQKVSISLNQAEGISRSRSPPPQICSALTVSNTVNIWDRVLTCGWFYKKVSRCKSAWKHGWGQVNPHICLSAPSLFKLCLTPPERLHAAPSHILLPAACLHRDKCCLTTASMLARQRGVQPKAVQPTGPADATWWCHSTLLPRSSSGLTQPTAPTAGHAADQRAAPRNTLSLKVQQGPRRRQLPSPAWPSAQGCTRPCTRLCTRSQSVAAGLLTGNMEISQDSDCWWIVLFYSVLWVL